MVAGVGSHCHGHANYEAINLTSEAAASTEIELLQRALDGVDQGLVLIDAECRIQTTNKLLNSYLCIPEELLETGTDYTKVIRFCHARGDFTAAAEQPNIVELIAEMTSHQAFGRNLSGPGGRPLLFRYQPVGHDEFMLTYRDISARHSTVLSLHESERRLLDFAEAGSHWFWELDENYHYTWFSDNFERNFGIKPGTRYGKGRLELIAEWAEKDGAAKHRQCLDQRLPFRNVITRPKMASDRAIWVSASGSPRYDDKDEFRGYRGVSSDISEEVAFREQAKTDAERFASAIDGVNENIALFDAQDRLIFCNETYRDLNGRIRDIIKPGVTFDEIIRANFATGLVLNTIGDVEEYSYLRLRQFHSPDGPVDHSTRLNRIKP
jgi:PAS domain S-box-containing protein